MYFQRKQKKVSNDHEIANSFPIQPYTEAASGLRGFFWRYFLAKFYVSFVFSLNRSLLKGGVIYNIVEMLCHNRSC